MDDFLLTAFRYAHTASRFTTEITTKLVTAATPLRSILTNASSSNPDLTNIALLLVVIYLSLSILGMATRWVYSIIRNIIRLGMFFALVGLGFWIWSSGPQEVWSVAEDVGMRLVQEGRKGAEEGYIKGQRAEGGGWPQGRNYA